MGIKGTDKNTQAEIEAGVNAATDIDALITELAKVPKSDATVSWNATALQAIQDEVEDALEGENLDHLLKTALPTNPATDIQADSALGELMGTSDMSTYDRSTDSLEALSGKIDVVDNFLDGTTATPDALRREHGKTQVIEVSITVAANAGITTVATVTNQSCLIKSAVIHADAAQTGDMNTCALEGGTGQVVEFIGIGDAKIANLNAADKQVSATGTWRLATSKTITIDLQGTGATAVDLTIAIEYQACVDGGYLV